jgi:hypothetical protein
MCKMQIFGRCIMWLSGWFYAFNLRKSEFLGTIDRNVPRNTGSLEESRELVRNQEEKLTGIFSRKTNSRENSYENLRKQILEKNPVKTGENYMVDTGTTPLPTS